MTRKRRRQPDGNDDYDPSSRRVSACKRIRVGPRVSLFDFSDEILLRIFAYLPVRQLLCIERVSQRTRRLAADTEIWRLKYFDHWIFTRLPGLRARSRRSLDELVRPKESIRWPGPPGAGPPGAVLRGGTIDWKRLYRIRRNWDKGAARFEEIKVASPASPPVLAEVCQGLILTADGRHGLRAWSKRDGRKQLLHQIALDGQITPLSLAADATAGTVTVTVGSDCGRIDLYRFRSESGFQKLLDFRSPTVSGVAAIALKWPYALNIAHDQTVHLHLILQHPHEGPEIWSATLLTSLSASVPFLTPTLSLRYSARTVFISISYAFNELNGGLCIGLQEVRLSTQGGVAADQLSYTVDALPEAKSGCAKGPLITGPPSSISYSHPYLLVCLPDNTIMAYVITSNDDKLEMSSGKRLWGHTSAISRAEVTHRGRAVSVSARGNEVRVWELEDELMLPSRGKTSTAVTPWSGGRLDTAKATANSTRTKGLGLTLKELRHTLALTQQWVGFDDEQVVVMCERDQSQIMACYDFTPRKAWNLPLNPSSRLLIDQGTPTCYNCGGEGHLSKECTNAPKPKTCYKCGQENHLARDCPDAAPAPNASAGAWGGAGAGGYGGGDRECYRCGGRGHIARDCTSSGGSSFGGGFNNGGNFGRGNTTTCYSCGGVGHMSRDCTQGRVQKCYNCGEQGHLSRECPSEQSTERLCYRCKLPGHLQSACPSA
ncbi:hypothetical protein DV738_g4173, partial [Chaetothyriales sp. CBS 135597]